MKFNGAIYHQQTEIPTASLWPSDFVAWFNMVLLTDSVMTGPERHSGICIPGTPEIVHLAWLTVSHANDLRWGESE